MHTIRITSWTSTRQALAAAVLTWIRSRSRFLDPRLSSVRRIVHCRSIEMLYLTAWAAFWDWYESVFEIKTHFSKEYCLYHLFVDTKEEVQLSDRIELQSHGNKYLLRNIFLFYDYIYTRKREDSSELLAGLGLIEQRHYQPNYSITIHH